MGASDFSQVVKGKTTAKEAFLEGVRQAQYDHGHAGYSGTLAEKDEFVEIELPVGWDATAYADKLIGDRDTRINDKWGPAGAIRVSPDEWLFFGWASS